MNNIEFAHNQQRAARIDDERSMIEAVDSLDNPFFELRTNEYGKGVYTKVVIKRGTLLKLFEPSHVDFNIPISMVPSMYRKYVAYVDAVHCNAPKDFEHMDIAWYINHADNPNVAPQETMRMLRQEIFQ